MRRGISSIIPQNKLTTFKQCCEEGCKEIGLPVSLAHIISIAILSSPDDVYKWAVEHLAWHI